MKTEPLHTKQTIKIWPGLLSLVCVGIAVLLAYSHKDQTSISGNIEKVSTYLWTSEARTFYPNLLHRQEVEKGELIGWTLDSSQYHATLALLKYVQEGKVESDTLEYLGSSLGIENPTKRFALQAKDRKPISNSTIPSINKITQMEFALDSLRRVWSQSGGRANQNDLLTAIQAAEFDLNLLKKRRERAILESDMPYKKQENATQSYNFKLLKSMIDSLLERNQVFAPERGIFILDDTKEEFVSYFLEQHEPHWITFIPFADDITLPQTKNHLQLRLSDLKKDFPILDVKSQDKGWLLKLPEQVVISELSGNWTILDQREHTLLKRWFSWRSQIKR